MTENIKNGIDWLLARLSENSTWRGIISVLTAFGVAIKPDKMAAIVSTGMALVGIINIFRQGSPTKSQVSDALDAKVDATPAQQLTQQLNKQDK